VSHTHKQVTAQPIDVSEGTVGSRVGMIAK
jgi:hypothetical protein